MSATGNTLKKNQDKLMEREREIDKRISCKVKTMAIKVVVIWVFTVKFNFAQCLKFFIKTCWKESMRYI